jgi:hypothetical protein
VDTLLQLLSYCVFFVFFLKFDIDFYNEVNPLERGQSPTSRVCPPPSVLLAWAVLLAGVLVLPSLLLLFLLDSDLGFRPSLHRALLFLLACLLLLPQRLVPPHPRSSPPSPPGLHLGSTFRSRSLRTQGPERGLRGAAEKFNDNPTYICASSPKKVRTCILFLIYF